MKVAFLLLISILAAAVTAPLASADDACENRPGYRHCEYTVGASPATCTAEYNYYYHDAFYAFQVTCLEGPKQIGISTYP